MVREGVKEFFETLTQKYEIIIYSTSESSYTSSLVRYLKEKGLEFDHLLNSELPLKSELLRLLKT